MIHNVTDTYTDRHTHRMTAKATLAEHRVAKTRRSSWQHDTDQWSFEMESREG